MEGGFPERVPDFVTHYYLPGRQPFQNLSELDEPRLSQVMQGLIEQRKGGVQHRLFGSKYMTMRRLVEERLYRAFVEVGGQPDRYSPHYFVLGESAWFQGLGTDMQQLRIPLSVLPIEKTSVTYPDSFTAMEVAEEFGLPHEKQPYHGQVFRLTDLPSLIATYGLPNPNPDSNYAGYERRSPEKYVEVQVWSDDSIGPYIAST
jgi:hypothetical protein